MFPVSQYVTARDYREVLYPASDWSVDGNPLLSLVGFNPGFTLGTSEPSGADLNISQIKPEHSKTLQIIQKECKRNISRPGAF